MVELDTNIYRLTAIKKATYKFGDRYHTRIVKTSANKVKVVFKSKNEKAKVEDANTLSGEFCNEVLDQELREIVAKETEAVRNLLLAQAFSATSLLDSNGDDGDYISDPKNIRQS
jgi:His-Xaa-Ser system protein HxsD